LTLLQCGGDGCGGNVDDQQQRIYCGMYLNNGEVIPENRYSINSWAHKHIDEGCSANSADSGSSGNCDKFRFEYNNGSDIQLLTARISTTGGDIY
jgi:hypothetical protein